MRAQSACLPDRASVQEARKGSGSVEEVGRSSSYRKRWHLAEQGPQDVRWSGKSARGGRRRQAESRPAQDAARAMRLGGCYGGKLRGGKRRTTAKVKRAVPALQVATRVLSRQFAECSGSRSTCHVDYGIEACVSCNVSALGSIQGGHDQRVLLGLRHGGERKEGFSVFFL